MSVKDVKKYYDTICDDYKEMRELLHELEDKSQQVAISPEKFDEITKEVQIQKDNYERWSYMIYLLNQPNKKEKKQRYNTQSEKKLQQISVNNTVQGVLKEDRECIDTFSRNIKNLS